ncbi:hypothetical protein PENTCL1PPCAC_7522, partial [Pristionchus entomophagus]
KKNCDNGEDEKDCLRACLKYPYFMRLNRGKAKCVPRAARCDGVMHFQNGIDKKNCAHCPSTAFQCDEGCLPSNFRCDGIVDCKDESDEKDCSCEECTNGRIDTYSCEATGICLKSDEYSNLSPYSLCPEPRKRDELFCATQWRR